MKPCVPAEWPAYHVTLRIPGAEYRVEVENPDRTGQGVRSLELDGHVCRGRPREARAEHRTARGPRGTGEDERRGALRSRGSPIQWRVTETVTVFTRIEANGGSMRVLVTGGAGYIGSVITDQLVADGHSVVVYDNLSRGHADAVADRATFVKADLLDEETLNTTLESHGIEAVIHMAASSLVGESMIYPERYYENNVVASVRLLNAITRANIKMLVFSSTRGGYGDPRGSPFPGRPDVALEPRTARRSFPSSARFTGTTRHTGCATSRCGISTRQGQRPQGRTARPRDASHSTRADRCTQSIETHHGVWKRLSDARRHRAFATTSTSPIWRARMCWPSRRLRRGRSARGLSTSAAGMATPSTR